MTPTREELLALAERVEALKEPCFATECEIEHAVSPHWTGEGLPNLYTASFDAALSLVPEGWVVGSFEWWPMKARSSVTLLEVADEGGWYGHDASKHASTRSPICPTPALALTAAALRALAETAQ